MDSLRPAGKLPNFDRLIKEGVSGPLRTLKPILSPIIWTSIATGKTPDKHGIFGFAEADTNRNIESISSKDRKVEALWNILTEKGIRSGIVGWWATSPPEEINGVMVSDRIGFHSYGITVGKRKLVEYIYPPKKVAEFQPLLVLPKDISYQETEKFIHISQSDFAKISKSYFDPKNRDNHFLHILAGMKMYETMSNYILQKEHPDFMAVYFEAVDSLSHLFMPFAPPKREEVRNEEYEKYKNVITAIYQEQDEAIGRLLKNVDKNTVVIIVSDHGFKTGASRPTFTREIEGDTAVDSHRLFGVLVVSGPNIKKDIKISDASVLDITPTILAILQLPVGQDMDGKVLSEIFQTAPKIKTIASYESGAVRRFSEPERLAKKTDDEYVERLQALGYISPNNSIAQPKSAEAAKSTQIELLNNQGLVEISKHNYQQALRLFNQALSLDSTYESTYNNLGSAFLSIGDPESVRNGEKAFRTALTLNPKNARVWSNLSLVLSRQNKYDEALIAGKKALALNPNYAYAYNAVGTVHM
ncbi:MAG: alkaline phosphatase family protein, partial [Candidatus Methanoperedens sp.]|nr:alkaline phosphatase family protein [Candidatus Methanoperedens sp.]